MRDEEGSSHPWTDPTMAIIGISGYDFCEQTSDILSRVSGHYANAVNSRFRDRYRVGVYWSWLLHDDTATKRKEASSSTSFKDTLANKSVHTYMDTIKNREFIEQGLEEVLQNMLNTGDILLFNRSAVFELHPLKAVLHMLTLSQHSIHYSCCFHDYR